jgi:hypothetical protein
MNRIQWNWAALMLLHRQHSLQQPLGILIWHKYQAARSGGCGLHRDQTRQLYEFEREHAEFRHLVANPREVEAGHREFEILYSLREAEPDETPDTLRFSRITTTQSRRAGA